MPAPKVIRRLAALLIAVFPLYFAGCGKEPVPVTETPRTTLNVFTAASLTESFTEMGKKFESANPGANVQFNFAGSQELRAQIESGAHADIFASANGFLNDVPEPRSGWLAIGTLLAVSLGSRRRLLSRRRFG